jgi:hypothetical protein
MLNDQQLYFGLKISEGTIGGNFALIKYFNKILTICEVGSNTCTTLCGIKKK